MHVRHYFAYGSNMNPARVAERGLLVGEVAGSVLADYRLTFNKAARDHAGFGHANIEYQAGAYVEGVLYELQDVAQILKMDPFERAPWNYGRDAVLVDCQGQPQWAWTYFANPAVKQAGLRPPAEYLAHLLAGQPWLSKDYYQTLLAWAGD